MLSALSADNATLAVEAKLDDSENSEILEKKTDEKSNFNVSSPTVKLRLSAWFN